MLKRQPPHRLYRKSASAVFCIINIQLGSIRIGKDLKLWHVFIYGVLAADDERDELNEIRGTMARVVLNAICSILDLENTLCNGSRKTVVKHLLQHRAITKNEHFIRLICAILSEGAKSQVLIWRYSKSPPLTIHGITARVRLYSLLWDVINAGEHYLITVFTHSSSLLDKEHWDRITNRRKMISVLRCLWGNMMLVVSCRTSSSWAGTVF